MKKVYLYHKTKKPKIFDECDIDKMKDKGWHISPIPFIKTTDFGIDPEDKDKVQAMGESILKVRDCVNGLLNLELMTIKQLREFAREFYQDLKHSKYRTKKALIFAIKDH